MLLIRVISILIAVVTVAWEVVVVLGWIAFQAGYLFSPFIQDLSLAMVIGSHTAAVALAAFSTRWLTIRWSGSSLTVLVFLLGFFFPGIGLPILALAGMVSFGPRLFRQDILTQIKEYVTYRKPDLEDIKSIDDVVSFIQTEIAIEPLVDIMNSDDPDLRRGAVEALSKIKSPPAIRLLKQARADSNLDVRIYANTALSRLDSEKAEALEAAEHKAAQQSDDPEAQIQFAREALDYAYSGLLEPETIPVYVNMAEAPVKRAYSLRPDHAETLELYGRVHLYQGRPEEAAAMFRQAMKMSGDSHAAELGLAESLFDMGRWDDLVTHCRALSQKTGWREFNAEAAAAVEMWAQ